MVKKGRKNKLFCLILIIKETKDPVTNVKVRPYKKETVLP